MQISIEVRIMTGFNVNCRDCKYYQLRTEFDDNDRLIFIEECTAFAPTIYEVDSYNNLDCREFEKSDK